VSGTVARRRETVALILARPPRTFDLSLREPAGSRSLHQLVRCPSPIPLSDRGSWCPPGFRSSQMETNTQSWVPRSVRIDPCRSWSDDAGSRACSRILYSEWSRHPMAVQRGAKTVAQTCSVARQNPPAQATMATLGEAPRPQPGQWRGKRAVYVAWMSSLTQLFNEQTLSLPESAAWTYRRLGRSWRRLFSPYIQGVPISANVTNVGQRRRPERPTSNAQRRRPNRGAHGTQRRFSAVVTLSHG